MDCVDNIGKMTVWKVIAIVSVMCTLQGVTGYTASLGQAEIANDRQSKNLFPFVWVTFKPSPCGTDNAGVCVQRGKCGKRGGTANGQCQEGNLGECCMFNAQCNTNQSTVNVDQLVTTLVAQSPTDVPCTFKFKKEPNICQIRLDFESFSMLKADNEGNCVDERLVISSSITVKDGFTTCGDLTGQHMYLTFGSQDAIELNTVLKANSNSKYRIVATRIPCDSQSRAPDYCLQYFSGSASGEVKSFGYGTGGQQQNDQRYTACIKPLSSSKSITWKPCDATSFDIISTYDGPPASCTTDYVIVKGEERSCSSFPTLTSEWKPYELLVNFDRMELSEPLPTFTMTKGVDPNNCLPADCDDLSVPTAYDCICIKEPATNQTCQCQLTIAGLQPTLPDFDNKGFCLTYTQ